MENIYMMLGCFVFLAIRRERRGWSRGGENGQEGG